MARDAEHDDICGYCEKNIYAGMHRIATSPFFTPPPERDKWIHTWCADELRAIEISKEEQQQKEQAKVTLTPLQEYDEPGPYSPQFVPIKEAADRTGFGVTTLHRMMDVGYAKGFKRGRFVYVELPKKYQLDH